MLLCTRPRKGKGKAEKSKVSIPSKRDTGP